VHWPPAAANEAKRRFGGYRLDPQGVPTFLFSVDGVAVEERIEGIENGLRRTVTWKAAALDSPAIAHPDGVSVTEEPGSAAGHRIFTYLWK
jgi:hypothetical protein